MAELKPCPFCGGESTVTHNGEGFTIVCENPDDCFAGEFGGAYTTNIQAEDAWNTRAAEPETGVLAVDGRISVKWTSVKDRLPENGSLVLL